MGDEIKIIGGVRILQSNIEQELPPVTKSEVGPNNVYTEYQEYRVKLKGGTILRFRDQAEANEAEVKFLENADGQREITFFGLNGAVITDTEENDNYNLSGCSGVTVNAGRTKSMGGGCTHRHRVGTDGDKITQSDRQLSNGEIQKSGANIAYTFGRGDKVSGGISSVDKNTNILADQENNPFEPKLTTTKIGRRLAKGKTEATVSVTSGGATEVNPDKSHNDVESPVIPPTPKNRPVVKGVPLPKKLPGRNMSMADTHQKIGNNYYYFNDYGMVEKIYQNDGKLKFELNTRYEETDPISYYRYYNYDSNGNMVQEIIQDLDENGNIIDPYVRETIERDDMGRRVRTIHYNIYDEPNCWWEHEYKDGRQIDYECHPNCERDCLGSNFNKWFDDSEFYLNGKR